MICTRSSYHVCNKSAQDLAVMFSIVFSKSAQGRTRMFATNLHSNEPPCFQHLHTIELPCLLQNNARSNSHVCNKSAQARATLFSKYLHKIDLHFVQQISTRANYHVCNKSAQVQVPMFATKLHMIEL